jgi:hypothetical protein
MENLVSDLALLADREGTVLHGGNAAWQSITYDSAPPTQSVVCPSPQTVKRMELLAS